MSVPPIPIITPRQVSGDTFPLPISENAAIFHPPTIGTPSINLDIIQIVGLIPVYPCDSEDCRKQCEPFCAYKNPVFGQTFPGLGVAGFATKSTYENDFNSWYFDFPLIKKNPTGFTVTFSIEKYISGAWVTSLPFINNSYGILYNFGSIAGHPTYKGLSVNWGAVLKAKGEGCYRLKVDVSYKTLIWARNYFNEPTLVTYTACAATPIFDLKEWDCKRAHGTAKFEIWNTGIIGDPYKDYFKHDLCGVLLFDSLRVRGFLGYPKSPTYKMDNNKWGPPKQGKIERVRDEQIQQWEYKSGLLPEYIHTRFSTFAMMCDEMLGSDYNINNSDWTVKRKSIIKTPNASYEPTFLDATADWYKRNKAHVTVLFNRGVQSVEKYNCCSGPRIGIIGGGVPRP